MLADVIGLVVYVSKFMYIKSYYRKISCLDVAIMNTRGEIIFMRVWDRHVGRHITRWRLAELEMWTLAATLLEVKQMEGGLSTTDESRFVFPPHNQAGYALEMSRAMFDATRGRLSRHVREAVTFRNTVARNDNLHVSTL